MSLQMSPSWALNHISGSADNEKHPGGPYKELPCACSPLLALPFAKEKKTNIFMYVF